MRSPICGIYLASLDNFENLHPYMYQQCLTVLIPKCTDYRDDIREFLKGMSKRIRKCLMQ
jgi:hypothetical protein